ncbi:uncharacterized protein A4U43_C02F13990 [Asparagus officinalis]|uniref:Uncharacterized protein n=1 Tax=Asparagus officinalis TaxID=4686 RepID=A0A5P1FN08_ASPOF|nr:uncharacterized protein A4U43_C02F13990 [Asparagus officinalis]
MEHLIKVGAMKERGHYTFLLLRHLQRSNVFVSKPEPMLKTLRGSELGKESILLDDDEEQVDYEPDDTDTYLTEPYNVGLDGDIDVSSYIPDDEPDFGTMGEAVPVSFPTGGHFEPVVNF